MVFKLIKQIDIFKSPIWLYLHRRNKKTNEKDLNYKMGSAFGGLLTLMLVIFSVFIITQKTIGMTDSLNDNIRQYKLSNKFQTNDTNFLNMVDFNFLPSVQVNWIDPSKHISESIVEFEELEKYVVVNLV